MYMYKHTFTQVHPYTYKYTNMYTHTHLYIHKYFTACGPLKHQRVMCSGRVSVPCFTSDTCHKL